MKRISDYANKCDVLRQIMSNKAQKYRRINAAQNIATVVVSSFLGFIGFSGTEKIQSYLAWFGPVDKLQIEFVFNLLVFAIFVLATLHLVFHFSKKQTDSEHAIVLLTNLSNQIDDLVSRETQGQITLTAVDLDIVRQKYEAVIQVIPANSDKEFLRAKKDFQEKERSQSTILLTPQALFDSKVQESTLRTLVLRMPQVMQILKAAQGAGSDLYLGGGIVRNLVWDYLHGTKTPTPIDDVDIVYFDQLSATKQHDSQIEGKLRDKIQNLQWSVKNQARMHVVNNEAPYSSLEDAISKWPETATAIAVRLSDDGHLQVVAPHGLSDLFKMLVRATPSFSGREARIAQRIVSKRWLETWPRLTVLVDLSLTTTP